MATAYESKPPTAFTIPFEHVSDTAFLVSAFRLLEKEQKNPLFDDSLAIKLLGARREEMLERGKMWKHGAWTMAVRTALIDEILEEFISKGLDTVVNIAAGLDLRPYRLPLPSSLHWIEVDYPELIQFKEERLKDEAPRCKLTRIKMDLSQPAEREAFLKTLQSLGRCVVLTEGLLMYLDPKDVHALSDGFSKAPNLVAWISDSLTASAMKALHEDQAQTGQPASNPGTQETKGSIEFKFLPEEGLWYFEKLGWKVSEFYPFHTAGPRMGRIAPEIGPHSTPEEIASKVGIGVLTSK